MLDKKSIPAEGRKKIFVQVQEKYEAERLKPPTIVIIGPAGVGKSSTINALFGTNLPVSDTKAGTSSLVKVPTSTDKFFHPKPVSGRKGNLILYDTPGISESLGKDEECKEMYRRILPECDVAVWVISAVDRRISDDQRWLRDVVRPANKSLMKRLVIGLNKVDFIPPIDWDGEANLPSTAQENSLNEIVEITMAD